METREYYEKVMQDYRSAMPLGSSKNQNRNGRSLRKYSCVPLVASDKVERLYQVEGLPKNISIEGKPSF